MNYINRYTFQMFQDNNELVWKFHRLSLVREYYDRCLFVPPLIILNHLKRALFFVLQKVRLLKVCNPRKENYAFSKYILICILLHIENKPFITHKMLSNFFFHFCKRNIFHRTLVENIF